MNFMDRMNKAMVDGPNNRAVTENGAVGYRTTGQKLLDMNFAVSSYRKKSEEEIRCSFAQALAEDFNAAVVWLFFARDVRGGLGERRLFRVCLQYLAREYPDTVRALLPLIAEYGRWDDVVCLIDTSLSKDACKLLASQLLKDSKALKRGESISLAAKWMPSENASSANTKKMAREIMSVMRLTPREYRKMLSKLRKKIGLVEQMMSQNKWADIEYRSVPSRANMIYNSAFLRHDEARRRAFLAKANKGEVKMNSATLFPHEIVSKYNTSVYGRRVNAYDEALEAMWKNLPNTVKGQNSSTIVVADGSGSMMSKVDSNSSVKAIDVANALAIYFAERLQGPYRDRYITFSETPQMVDMRGCTSLAAKLRVALAHDEVANTNIEAVFDLILSTAVSNRLSQNEIPSNILVISDMEFDNCTTGNGYVRGSWGVTRNKPLTNTLFGQIEARFRSHGYKMPRLVFWNVASRSGAIPVRQNDLGVALVSGFSPNVAKMVMSNKTNPYDALMDTLNGERYHPVWGALKNCK